MGNMCGTDIYTELKQQYGDKLTQWIVSKTVSSTIGEKINGLKSSVTGQAETIKATNLQTIDAQKASVTSQFNSLKQSLSKSYPGGLDALQQNNGTSVDKLLGYNDQIQKFTDLKQNMISKFGTETSNLTTSLSSAQSQATSSLPIPSVPGIDNLTQTQQKGILATGAGEFKDQIASATSNLFSGSQFKPQTYIDKFKSILPLESLTGITNNANSEMLSKAKAFGVSLPTKF